MTTIRTIRKNTKEASEVLARATGARAYCLSNDFVGEDVEAKYAAEALHRFDFAKLTANEDTYTVRVHSNLWYELTL